jgi:DNA replication protein DnaC
MKLAQAAQAWASAFKRGDKPRWLSIIGTSGAGKTYVAKTLWRYANSHSQTAKTVQRGGYNYNEDTLYTPHVVFWPDFIQKLRSGSAFDLRNDMKSWPVLFLDDIGAERDPSGYAAEELNTLLGCRVGKWTLITSNKDADALKAIDGRIFSRLIRDENICVSVNTQDFAER